MLSLVLVVFLIHLALFLINTIGASTIDNLLWLLYLRLPTSTSQHARDQARIKRDVVLLKREMNNTSSQDEFAKWAKLRRRHDKTMEEYEAMNTKLTAQKASFDLTVKTVRWLSTSGFKLVLQFYYSRTPVFYLPPRWLPYYVQWILSFPRAPLGSVSIQVWSSVCGTAITVLAEMGTLLVLQTQTQKQPEKQAQKEAQREEREKRTEKPVPVPS